MKTEKPDASNKNIAFLLPLFLFRKTKPFFFAPKPQKPDVSNKNSLSPSPSFFSQDKIIFWTTQAGCLKQKKSLPLLQKKNPDVSTRDQPAFSYPAARGGVGGGEIETGDNGREGERETEERDIKLQGPNDEEPRASRL